MRRPGNAWWELLRRLDWSLVGAMAGLVALDLLRTQITQRHILPVRFLLLLNFLLSRFFHRRLLLLYCRLAY